MCLEGDDCQLTGDPLAEHAISVAGRVTVSVSLSERGA